MSEFQIQSGIALPPARRNTGPIVTALKTLLASKVGDSVYIPGKRPNKIGPYVKSAGGKGRLVSRTEGDGSRVWKIK